MYEIYCKLRDLSRLKDADVAKATGITKSTFSDWKSGRSKPKPEKLQKIADLFGVTMEYLTTGEEFNQVELTIKDKKDIAKELESIMEKLDNGDDGPVRYNGQVIDDNSRILLRNALELGLTQLKVENKKLYNPNKNKK
jgi:transcriptional regulator with XRE-family HTH domain